MKPTKKRQRRFVNLLKTYAYLAARPSAAHLDHHDLAEHLEVSVRTAYRLVTDARHLESDCRAAGFELTLLPREKSK